MDNKDKRWLRRKNTKTGREELINDISNTELVESLKFQPEMEVLSWGGYDDSNEKYCYNSNSLKCKCKSCSDIKNAIGEKSYKDYERIINIKAEQERSNETVKYLKKITQSIPNPITADVYNKIFYLVKDNVLFEGLEFNDKERWIKLLDERNINYINRYKTYIFNDKQKDYDFNECILNLLNIVSKGVAFILDDHFKLRNKFVVFLLFIMLSAISSLVIINENRDDFDIARIITQIKNIDTFWVAGVALLNKEVFQVANEIIIKNPKEFFLICFPMIIYITFFSHNNFSNKKELKQIFFGIILLVAIYICVFSHWYFYFIVIRIIVNVFIFYYFFRELLLLIGGCFLYKFLFYSIGAQNMIKLREYVDTYIDFLNFITCHYYLIIGFVLSVIERYRQYLSPELLYERAVLFTGSLIICNMASVLSLGLVGLVNSMLEMCFFAMTIIIVFCYIAAAIKCNNYLFFLEKERFKEVLNITFLLQVVFTFLVSGILAFYFFADKGMHCLQLLVELFLGS